MKAILIDDENSANKSLKIILEQYFSEIKIVDISTKLLDAKKSIMKHNPDILFLDIELRDGSGFDLLQAFPDPKFYVVFVTAYSEHAIKAIKIRAVDYLLKPVDVDELSKTIHRISLDRQEKELTKYHSIITVPSRQGKAFIKVNSVIRAEAEGSYCTIHMDTGVTHTLSNNLKSLEKLLDPKSFFRCHNSHLINIGKVQELITEQGTVAVMEDNSEVFISIRKKNDFLEAVKSYAAVQ